MAPSFPPPPKKTKRTPKNTKRTPKITKSIFFCISGIIFVFLEGFLYYLGKFCFIWGIIVLFEILFVFFGGIFVLSGLVFNMILRIRRNYKCPKYIRNCRRSLIYIINDQRPITKKIKCFSDHTDLDFEMRPNSSLFFEPDLIQVK
jgi:hypothetical protein